MFLGRFKLNSKYLQPNDIVCMCIASKILSLDQIVDLINFLCVRLELYKENKQTLLPISFYKVFVLHEVFDLFDYFYMKEQNFPREYSIELLKYAITSSSMMFVVYYIRKYNIKIATFKTALIWQFLYKLETFVKSLNQNFTYEKSIDDEIGVYLIEILLPSFTFKQARLL